MLDMGYPLHLVQLLVKLYHKECAKTRVAGVTSDWFQVKELQRCFLSPYFFYLFNILAEAALTEALDGFNGGIAIGGRMLSNLRMI